jgi:flagellar hook protein FlgE
MTDALTIAASALRAQQINLGVIASNVANAETPGYKPQQATFIPMNPGIAVGPVVASADASVDIGSELVNLILAKTAYAAAAKIASASNEMTHTLLKSF